MSIITRFLSVVTEPLQRVGIELLSNDIRRCRIWQNLCLVNLLTIAMIFIQIFVGGGG